MSELTTAERARIEALFASARPEPRHYAAAEALRSLDEVTDDSVSAVLAEFLQPHEAEPEAEI